MNTLDEQIAKLSSELKKNLELQTKNEIVCTDISDPNNITNIQICKSGMACPSENPVFGLEIFLRFSSKDNAYLSNFKKLDIFPKFDSRKLESLDIMEYNLDCGKDYNYAAKMVFYFVMEVYGLDSSADLTYDTWADEKSVQENIELNNEEKLLSKKYNDGHYVVPSWKIKVESEDIDFPVREYIKSVEFQDGMLEEIGIMAFSDTNISKINIPSSVSKIDATAFESCNVLESITVDKDNEWFCSKNNCCLTIDESILVFGCKASVIPDSVKIIGEHAFSIKSLKSINIPNGVKEIQSFAFSSSGLTNVEIPESVEVMDEFSFSNCYNLKSFFVSPNNKHFYSKDNKCYSRDTNELIFEPKSLIENMSEENILNSESDKLSKHRQKDADAMRIEILSPEEERKFLRQYLSILFHDRVADLFKREHPGFAHRASYRYDLVDEQNCMLSLTVDSPGCVEITSNDRSGGCRDNSYYLEFKTADGNTFKYGAQDDYYSPGYSYIMNPDMANSVLQQGTIVNFSIGYKEFELDIPIPRMYNALQFLLAEENFSDEKVDELYDAVFIQLKEKVKEKKQKERDARKTEEERQRKINEEKAASTPQTNVNNGCYIATCVYGSYDCPEVWVLRRFRDYTLDETWYGRLFIKVYYTISPSLVNWFGKTRWFKSLLKKPLDSLVSKLRSNGVSSSPYNDKY